MYVVFLAGGIASGKSSVAAEFERLGASRIDLDQLSRDVLSPTSATTAAVVAAFGDDLIDSHEGTLNRRLLAARAFATPDAAARLEAIELPAIRARLRHELATRSQRGSIACCVVEVALLDRIGDLLDLADEVLAVVCPLGLRRVRAVQRGMDAADFDARAANQPSESWLRDHASTVIDNAGTAAQLRAAARAWWAAHFGT